MTTEQELIDIINALIDADMQSRCEALEAGDIARRALERCTGGLFTEDAVIDLVSQILTARCEPWKFPPGARPRLREFAEGVPRLQPKPSVAEMLEAGRRADESFHVTLSRVRRAYPKLTEATLKAEIDAYETWLQDCGHQMRREMERLRTRIEHDTARKRELARIVAIAKPALDEDSSLTLAEALRVMAERGCAEARRELEGH